MSVSSTWAPIVRHELLVAGKVTFLTYAVQLVFQLLPLEHTNIFILTWVLTPLALALGLISDVRFYGDALDNSIRKERIKCNALLCLLSWVSCISFFRYLDLSWKPETDREIAENAIPGLGIQLLLERVFEANGYLKGLALLLGAHFTAVATFASSIRTALFIVEYLIRNCSILARFLPKMAMGGEVPEPEPEGKAEETSKEKSKSD